MYFLYSSIFFALSLTSIRNRKKTLKLFLILACAIPSSFAFEKQVSLFGFYFFEHFYWLTIPLAILTAAKKGIPKNLLIATAISAILFISILISIPYYDDDTKYILRDFRLVITLLAAASLIVFFRTVKLTPEEITTTTALCATLTIASYLAVLFDIFSFNNVYYSTENKYRYFAAGTYLCCAFLIFSLTNKSFFQEVKGLTRLATLLSAIVILISGYRVLILGLALGITISLIKNPMQAMRSIAISATLVLVGIEIAFALEIERVTSALNAAGILAQLNTRYSPALSLIENFTTANYLFGMGIGKTFEIPWFEYQGLDTKHNMVDSTYLTLFVKFGASCTLYIASLMAVFTAGASKKAKTASAIFLLIMMLTFPIAYHPTIIIFIIPFFAMNNSTNQMK